MLCPKCATPNPEAIKSCVACGEDLGSDDKGMAPTASGMTAGFETPSSYGATFTPGTILADRYRIIAAIGMGGMGMVYKALDLDLSVPVALKVIRAEYSGNEKILERFKREITIARRVTHKNVARIYDMGEAEHVRYISMEYIDGVDLAHIVENEGALPTEKVIEILRQCCLGLREAHTQGIVHRDLKPHNVMLDKNGEVHVMDFGIALSQETRGLTRTGAILGTAEYMSPEQAEGRKIDHRADIYSLGITIYEAVTGTVPFSGETQWEVIRKQMQDRPRAPRRLRAETPAWLETVILKCLEKDPAHRYQSVDEILVDLDRQKATRSLLAYVPKKRNLATGVAAIVLALVAATTAYMLRPKGITPGPGGRLSVAVLPFDNQASRQDLDWLRTGLAENLSTDLAQSKYLRVITRERLSQILKDLGQPPDTPLDRGVLKGIAEYAGAQAVFTGSFVAAGDMLRINLLAQEPESGEVINSAVVSGPEGQVLAMIDQLTVKAKEILSISRDKIDTDVDTSIASARTSSLEAASLFQRGVDYLYEGQNLEAIEPLEQAVKEDPDFSLAYARLSQAYRNLGYDDKAQEAGERALSRLIKSVDRVTLADRALVRAVHAASSDDREGAIEAYAELLNADPFDATAAYNLGYAYEMSGQWAEAANYYKKAQQLDKNFAQARTAAGRISIKSGKPRESLQEFEGALEVYKKIGSKEGEASTYQALCNAYIGMQEWDKALSECDKSDAIKEAIGDKRGLGATLGSKAYILQVTGRLKQALQAAERSLSLHREIGDARGTAIGLISRASLLEDQGSLAEAVRADDEAIEMLRSLGDKAGEAETLCQRGRLRIGTGELAVAQSDLAAAQKLNLDLGNETGVAQTNSDLGLLALARGDLAGAADQLSRAMGQWKDLDIPEGVSESKYRLARVEILQGLYGSAIKHVREAFEDYQSVNDKLNSARCRSVLGMALIGAGQLDEAQEQLDGALASAEALGNDLLAVEILSSRAELLSRRGDSAGAAAQIETGCSAGKTAGILPSELRCDILRSELALAGGDTATAAKLAVEASRRAADAGMGILQLQADLAGALAAAAGKPGAGAAASDVTSRAEKAGAGAIVLRAAPLAIRSQNAAGPAASAAGSLAKTLQAARSDVGDEASGAFLDEGVDAAAIQGAIAQLRKLGLGAEADRLAGLSSK